LEPELLGQFLEKLLSFFLMKKSVEQMWSQFGKVEVFSLENWVYIFRFNVVMTRDEVVESRMWQLRMLLLKLSVSSIPIWIKLLHLPMEFWDRECLVGIASGVGKALSDSVTEQQLRLGFARVVVEVDVELEIPKELDVVDGDGKLIIVGIEYPWIPIKCPKCKAFGHSKHACLRKGKKLWWPKFDFNLVARADGNVVKQNKKA
jgi:hypothetical protein